MPTDGRGWQDALRFGDSRPDVGLLRCGYKNYLQRRGLTSEESRPRWAPLVKAG